MRIKVFPETGPAYVVELPEVDPDTGADIGWTQGMIEDWVDGNLANVDSWEVEE